MRETFDQEFGVMNPWLDKIEYKLQEFLGRMVKFALLYGSVLTKYFNQDSDIDMALFLGQKIEQKSLLDLREEISGLFQQKYDFDLLLLDSADPIIAMQILANGKLIIDNERHAFITYKAGMISQYIDFKMARKIIEDRIAEGSIYA